MQATLALIAMPTAWISAYAAPILAVINFLWLLVKDETLFSWYWPIGFAIAFILSIGIILYFVIKNQ